MDGEFSFTAAELDRGGKAYSFVIEPSWLRGELETRKPLPAEPSSGQPAAELPAVTASDVKGSVNVRASKSDKEVVVHGRAEASLQVTCARCLSPFDLPVKGELSALFVPKGKLRSGEGADYEFSAAEADVEAYDGEIVVLDSLVVDVLLLEIPMIPLCSEDCPGMSPPSEGLEKPEEPAIDPRLLPLMRFKGSA